jgi:hypothetical protein
MSMPEFIAFPGETASLIFGPGYPNPLFRFYKPARDVDPDRFPHTGVPAIRNAPREFVEPHVSPEGRDFKPPLSASRQRRCDYVQSGALQRPFVAFMIWRGSWQPCFDAGKRNRKRTRKPARLG